MRALRKHRRPRVAAVVAALVAAIALVALAPAVAGALTETTVDPAATTTTTLAAPSYVPLVPVTEPPYVPEAPITTPAPPAPTPRVAAPAPTVAPTEVVAPAEEPPAEVEGIVQVPKAAPLAAAAPEEVPPGDLSIMSTGIPEAIDWTPSFVASNVGLGAVLVLLLLAASQLFNDAMKMHHDRIVSSLATRSALVAGVMGAFGRVPRLHPVVTFALAAGALGLLADPNVSFSVSTLGQMLGMGLALLLMFVIYDGTASRVITKATGERRIYRIFPIAIAIALGCLVASRVFGVAPGVLYGLFIGAIFVGELDRRVEGWAYARASVLLMLAAMVAWGVHRWVDPTASNPSANLLAIMLDTTAAVLFVGGLQSVIVNLLPMPFLWGESVIRWNRWGWGALLLGSIALYMQFVVRPNPDAVTLKNLWFMFLFVGAALLFWGFCVARRWADQRGSSEHEDDVVAAP